MLSVHIPTAHKSLISVGLRGIFDLLKRSTNNRETLLWEQLITQVCQKLSAFSHQHCQVHLSASCHCHALNFPLSDPHPHCHLNISNLFYGCSKWVIVSDGHYLFKFTLLFPRGEIQFSLSRLLSLLLMFSFKSTISDGQYYLSDTKLTDS